MPSKFPFLFTALWFFSCASVPDAPAEIVNVVGEIYPDEALDDPNFKTCQEQERIIQYYAFDQKTYRGEKAAIIRHFREKYMPVGTPESGMIRIRFVVNCQGKSGRFRLLSMDGDYNPMTFSKDITDQLMSLTKTLDGWEPMEANGIKWDYYQYLLFKMEKGRLIEIMP